MTETGWLAPPSSHWPQLVMFRLKRPVARKCDQCPGRYYIPTERRVKMPSITKLQESCEKGGAEGVFSDASLRLMFRNKKEKNPARVTVIVTIAYLTQPLRRSSRMKPLWGYEYIFQSYGYWWAVLMITRRLLWLSGNAKCYRTHKRVIRIWIQM